MAGLSDRELWRRASEGETEAFGQLFDRHAKAVYNFLFRRTTSWSDAEDLTSLVFLHAWRRRDEVVLVHDSALPWLLRTADYVVRNERRRQHFRWATVLKHPATADEPDLADGVASRVDEEREARKLRRRRQELLEAIEEQTDRPRSRLATPLLAAAAVLAVIAGLAFGIPALRNNARHPNHRHPRRRHRPPTAHPNLVSE